ncbi:head-tail connector protein [Xylocopilactobacillus apis]|uniref:DNA packaging protein n=1 Tax=Xylocopilactobacillus apis TaxID=2932183 RepID=A0AAU9D7X9_9LACO|nr:head-tail connector protein [Xylocopilactobacillus apis]BDR56882.1 DNA packaging protein [Xylocopilactobacillus apis]
MTITTDDLKRSLRLLDDDVDSDKLAQLQSYLDAAKSYVDGAVGGDDDFYNSTENQDIYKTVVLALATAYYQNPSAVTTGSVTNVNLVLDNIIMQLRVRLLRKRNNENGSNE